MPLDREKAGRTKERDGRKLYLNTACRQIGTGVERMILYRTRYPIFHETWLWSREMISSSRFLGLDRSLISPQRQVGYPAPLFSDWHDEKCLLVLTHSYFIVPRSA